MSVFASGNTSVAYNEAERHTDFDKCAHTNSVRALIDRFVVVRNITMTDLPCRC